MKKLPQDKFDPPVAMSDISVPSAPKANVQCAYALRDRVRDVLLKHRFVILDEEVLGVGKLDEEKAKAGIAEHIPELYVFTLEPIELTTLEASLREVTLDK